MLTPHRRPEGPVSHANARLTVHGRAELARRVVTQGRPVAHVVVELNISRAPGDKWLARWRAQGPAGLIDRPSRAHRLPGKTSAELEGRVLALRADRKLGPARIGPLVGLAPSTVHAVLTRHGMHRLAWMDRPTGEVVRRYERGPPRRTGARRRQDAGRHPRRRGLAPTAAAPPRATTAATNNSPAAAWATTTSTAPSMTTPAWPAPRSTPTRPPPPAPGSYAQPPPGSPPSASLTSHAS